MSAEIRGFDPTMEARNREERGEVAPEVRDHFVEKLKHGSVAALLRTLLSDPVTQRRFLETHKDRGAFMVEKKQQTTIERISAIVVSLMRDAEYRKLFIDTVQTDFHEGSSLRHAGIRKAVASFEAGELSEEDRAALVYDEVVLGAGVHAAIYNSRRTMDNPTVKSLTVEAGSVISANFRTKAFVRINSANSPHQSGTPSHSLKTGNLNYFGKRAPVQIPYIESERFPSADTIADVATANQFLSNSDVLFDAPARVVLPWQDPNSSTWPARYKVEVGKGEYVFANRVELGTGYGEATLPDSFDEESLRVVAEARENQAPDAPPPVMTYEGFATFVTESETPFRHFVGKTIDMAGGGDSAATTIEFMLRWAKKAAYKKDIVQVGEVKRVNWVGQKTLTREEFYKMLENDRYAQIAGEMPIPLDKRLRGAKEKKIHPIPGHLVQVRKSDKPELGRFRAIYQSKDETTGEPVFREGYTDVVITAVGYKDRMAETLGMKENPFDDPNKAEAVKGTFEDIDARLPVAVKLKGEEVYVMGPASIGNVLVEAEFAGSAAEGRKKGKKDIAISIATFGPRTEKLAEINAAKDGVRDLPRTDFAPERIALTVLETDEALPKPVLLSAKGVERISEHMVELRTKLAIAEVFEQFQVPTYREDVTVTFKYISKDSVGVTFFPAMVGKSCEELCNAFSRYGLPDLVLSQMNGNRFPELNVLVPFTPKGNVDVAGISINKPAHQVSRTR